MTNAPASAVPLCVDLDGTLIDGDINAIAFKKLMRRKPWALPLFAVWALRGRPYLKERMAALVTIDPSTLPYRADVLHFLEQEHARGRRIILATASGRDMVSPILEYLSLLDATLIATDRGKNLSGRKKAEALVAAFGEKGFDYMGNERRDIAIWKHARKAYVVHAPKSVEDAAKKLGNVERVFG